MNVEIPQQTLLWEHQQIGTCADGSFIHRTEKCGAQAASHKKSAATQLEGKEDRHALVPALPWYQPSGERLGVPGLRTLQGKHGWTFQPLTLKFLPATPGFLQFCEAQRFRGLFMDPFQLL